MLEKLAVGSVGQCSSSIFVCHVQVSQLVLLLHPPGTPGPGSHHMAQLMYNA